MLNNNTYILIEVELPVKCSKNEFEDIYSEHYINEITHEFIRKGLNLPEDSKIKLNGKYKRNLCLLDNNNNLYDLTFKVQTALYFDPQTDKTHYVSIIPSFIKKHCRFSLSVFEYLAKNMKEGETIFEHIYDPLCLIECEDDIVRPLIRIEEDASMHNYSALLCSSYTLIHNRILLNLLTIENIIELLNKKASMVFKATYELIVIAYMYFGAKSATLPLVNKLINL